MSTIILASESYLKKFIFDKAKLPYGTVSPKIDETMFDNAPIESRVVRLAEEKAKVVAASNPQSIIISADTLTADMRGNVFNKLAHKHDPFTAALQLSAQTIEIYTGCTVYHQSIGYVSYLSKSSIKYQKFSEPALRRLIEHDDASIRSGALGIFYDAPGFTLIERIEGSYTGSYGLPMEFVYKQLENLAALQ